MEAENQVGLGPVDRMIRRSERRRARKARNSNIPALKERMKSKTTLGLTCCRIPLTVYLEVARV